MTYFPALLAAALALGGCTKSSNDASNEPAPPELSGQYKEYVGNDTFHLVNVDLDDCSLVVSTGPMDSLARVTTTCSEAERARGVELLGETAWEGYEPLPALPPPSDGGAGGSGTGDAEPANPESDCSDCGTEPEGELGSVGSGASAHEGVVFITRNASRTLMFDGESDGPEGELVSYFRDLYSKYSVEP